MENIYLVYAAGPKLEFCYSEMLSSEKVGLGKYDVQTHTNENKTSYMLVIRNISEVDAGEYYCSLTREGQTSYICDRKTGILYVNGKWTNCKFDCTFPIVLHINNIYNNIIAYYRQHKCFCLVEVNENITHLRIHVIQKYYFCLIHIVFSLI